MKFIALALASTALIAAPSFAQSSAPADQSAPAATAPAGTTAPSSAPTSSAAPAASATPNVTAGAQVADAQGGAVGTIESVSGSNAVLSTGTVKATLPLTAFAQGPNGLVIGMTKADVEVAVAKAGGGAQSASASGGATASTSASAAPSSGGAASATQSAAAGAPASITVGATVSDPKGGVVGKVAAVSGNLVTVATANAKAQLPKTAFAQSDNGLVIGMTATELEAAAKAAAPKKS